MKLTQDKNTLEAAFGDLSAKTVQSLRESLLSHYDNSGRTLPWRIRPEDRKAGRVADPYAVWLSEIMLQQTTVAHATPYWEAFLGEFPTVTDLASADRDRVLTLWAGLGYYARARNLHACARKVRDEFGGVFPKTEKALLKLPGIGLYTAAAIAAICYHEPTNVVDGNVERVISRFFAVEKPLPKARALLRALAGKLADPNRPGDYAQAIMDLGARTCTPRSPLCVDCPWSKACRALRQGDVTTYPKKEKKRPKPVRYGAVFILSRGEGTDRELFLQTRPDDGLLGGMRGFPGTEWSETGLETPQRDLNFAPLPRNWERCAGQVTHIFTHFELRLRIYRADAPVDLPMPDGDGAFVPYANLDDYALPTVMKKALAHARATLAS